MSGLTCGCDPEAKWVCAGHSGTAVAAIVNSTRSFLTPKAPPPKGLLPTDSSLRKQFPLWTGVMMYFPDAMLAVSEVSRLGNEQHNFGEPLHWAREKSTDQMNTAARHMLDHSRGNIKDTDGAYHLAKAIWRLSAELQLAIEAGR